MTITILWYVTPCSPVDIHKYFGVSSRLTIQSIKATEDYYVLYEVPTYVAMKITVLWDVTTCSLLNIYQLF
jgi:hypothetical protein